MSCKELKDNRIQLKTELPAQVGDFWLGRATEKAKNIVRLFTRLSLQNNGLRFIDYLEDLISISPAFINSLPQSVDITNFPVTVKNFYYENFSSTSHNGFPVESIVPLRKTDINQIGVFALDPETSKIWQDPNGGYWLWQVQIDPEEISEELPNNEVSIINPPEYAVEWDGTTPTLILSKKGYLVYGLDFRCEDGFIIFTEDPKVLFDQFMHISSGYEKRTTLLSFPFSVDPETPGVEHITKFLRNNTSAKYLEEALSQVAGYTSVPDISIILSKRVPKGNILVGITGEVVPVLQSTDFEKTYTQNSFPGEPIKVLYGPNSNALNFLSANSNLVLPSLFGEIILRDQEYACLVNESGFVQINLGDEDSSAYTNSLRMVNEAIPRFNEDGDLLPTFSSYLIDKYAPGAEEGDVFYVNLFREYTNLMDERVLLILLSSDLDHEQRQAAIDFLQTHTPLNAIIITDTIWE